MNFPIFNYNLEEPAKEITVYNLILLMIYKYFKIIIIPTLIYRPIIYKTRLT